MESRGWILKWLSFAGNGGDQFEIQENGKIYTSFAGGCLSSSGGFVTTASCSEGGPGTLTLSSDGSISDGQKCVGVQGHMHGLHIKLDQAYVLLIPLC
jgi:hypothetical protein